VEGLVCFMNTKDGIIGPINLGNPEEFTILELAERILKLTGSKSEIRFEPLPQGDPKKRQPDKSMAKRLLRWEPGVWLDEGLIKTIDYFNDVL
jgi:UDP-glucuronate decarboxylase